MQLIELRISNFRGLGGNSNTINFENSNVIFLIGQNNVGKSSFLHAYEFFVNPSQKAVTSGYFQYKTDNAIEIEADFIRETEDDDNPDFADEPDWINKWVQTDTGMITIKKFTKKPDGDFIENGFGGMDTLFTKYAPTPIAINAIETVETLLGVRPV